MLSVPNSNFLNVGLYVRVIERELWRATLVSLCTMGTLRIVDKSFSEYLFSCPQLSDQGLKVYLPWPLTCRIWDVGSEVLWDSFPWVSCSSACHMIRGTDCVLKYLFKNLYIVSSLWQRYCHLLKQRAGLLTSLEARHNFSL